jgi:hypothetical protein
MGLAPIRDHTSPQQDLAHVLHEVLHSFRAVLGKRSIYDAQAQTLAGRVECYKRGHDGIVTAQQIVHEGLGGPKKLPWVEEFPRDESVMKREAARAIKTVHALEKRYRVSAEDADAD